MKQLLHLFLLLAGLLLSACSQPYAENEIRFALSQAPISFDPRLATDAASERINRLLYQRLVEHDISSRPVPGIASWQQLSDTHYRFTLNSQPIFHHGKALTAYDVVETYQSVLDDRTASPHKGLLKGIKTISAFTDRVIDFHIMHKDNLFPGRLTIGIVPADLLASGHDFGKSPVGSGAFRYMAVANETDHLLERLDDKQRFRFVEVKDATVRVLKLIKGEIDILQNDISPELFRWLGDNTQVKTRMVKGNNFTYLGTNMSSNKLADWRVRRAIAHAVDRKALVKYVLHDKAALAESTLEPVHWAAHSSLTPYPYDKQKARALLEEAGWDEDRPLELVYKTSTDPLRVRIANIIAEQLAEVGIRIRLQSLDWGTFYGDIKSGNFELYSLSWVGIRSPDILEYIFHSKSVPPAGANRGRYINKLVDERLDYAFYKSSGNNARKALLQAQAQVHQDLPYIPLWYEHQFYAVRKNISGYALKPDGNYDGLANTNRISSDKHL